MTQPPISKTILITGCSSGIGLNAAQTLAARGHRVFAAVRRNSDVEALSIEASLTPVLIDLDDSRSIQSGVEDVLQQTNGHLDVLFNNAAFGLPGAVEDLSRQALKAQFETNLFGTHELTQQIIPVMRAQQSGRIIQNSSVLGIAALAYRGAYVASKFALEGLSDTLRLELAGSGIDVVLIQPGPITSRFRHNSEQAFLRWIDAEHSIHKQAYQAQLERMRKPGPAAPFTLPADAVTQKLIHAVESPRPKARYPVTVPTHLFAWLKRVLSTRMMDRVLQKASGGGRR